MPNNTSVEIACDLARRFEGCRLVPYRCPAGLWTIGWGHLITPDPTAPRPDLSWSQDQADAALLSDMGQFDRGVRLLLKQHLAEAQIGALSDFAFNLGLRALRASTLMRLLNQGDAAGAADQFPKWVFAGGRKLPGLIARREAERAIFVGAMV